MRITFALLICALPALVAAELAVNKLHTPLSLRKRGVGYDYPSRVIDKDVRELLNSLTLKEKIGQLTQLNINTISYGSWSQFGLNLTAVEYYAKEWGVGSFLNQAQSNETWLLSSKEYASWINQINDIYKKHTKHGIPILYGLDSVRGAHYLRDATILPSGISLASTFNPSLVEASGAVTAFESAMGNVRWSFSPILDLGINKLWPRFYENFGEDPYLTAIMGAAAIHGLQGKYKSDPDKIAACLKHYIGYGGTHTGQDHDNAWIPINYLLDYHVPAFKAGVDAGAATLMTSYSAVNGQPITSSKYFLDTLLRKELGFNGLVVTDWQEGYDISDHHHSAKDHYQAVIDFMNAGIDMSMTPTDTEFNTLLAQAVAAGKVSIETVNNRVGHALQLKKDLGVFSRPNVDLNSPKFKQVGSKAHADVALNAIRESITLLQNTNNVLPAKSPRKIAVVGPSSNDKGYQCGGWCRRWQGVDNYSGFLEFGNTGPVVDPFLGKGQSLIEGVREVYPHAEISFIEGTDIWGNETADWQTAIDYAKAADLTIIGAGEFHYAERVGRINNLDLPQGLIDFINAIGKVSKKSALVLYEGRPRSLQDIPANVDAILMAYLPGPYGGLPAAEIIAGKVNPSGRLPFSYPLNSADFNYNYWRGIDQTYNEYGVTNNTVDGPDGVQNHVYREFGDGLSYSTFTYSPIKLSGTHLTRQNTLYATVTVTNHGPYDGKHTVLFYTQQKWRSIEPEYKLLKGFEKVDLKVGQSAKVTFPIVADFFKFTTFDGRPALESSDFNIFIDQSGANFYPNATFTLTL